MPSPPRATTPLRLLTGLAGRHWRRVLLGSICFACAGATAMSQLWMIGKVIDDGLIARDGEAFARWIGIIACTAIVQGFLWSRGFRLFGTADARAQRSIVRRLTDRLNLAGTGIRGRVSAGELVNLPSEDSRRATRAIAETGFLLNNTAMFTTGVVLVWTIHPLLGVVIVAGSLLTALLAGPLLGRLQQRQSDYRAHIGHLTADAADIVGGLRVLRGIGGDVLFAERYRARSDALRDMGYQVANPSSWIHALRHSMPILFVAAITWTGAILAVRGDITIGGLASASSFATIFIAVSGNFLSSANFFVAAWVGAKRIARVLSVESDIADEGAATGATGTLRDGVSGLTVQVGALTVVVTAETAPAQEACERLARYRESDARWGDLPLADFALAEVRERIMLLTDEDYLFAESLRSTLRVDPDAALAAVEAACAADVYTGLGSDLDAQVAEGGRNLSGGQRQRLRLARALAAEPETLLAVEPTSAVDSHTESLIAERVAATRAEATTVVVTASPLWLAHADRVVWMVDGKVHAEGAHSDLLADPDYRRLASHLETA